MVLQSKKIIRQNLLNLQKHCAKPAKVWLNLLIIFYIVVKSGIRNFQFQFISKIYLYKSFLLGEQFFSAWNDFNCVLFKKIVFHDVCSNFWRKSYPKLVILYKIWSHFTIWNISFFLFILDNLSQKLYN